MIWTPQGLICTAQKAAQTFTHGLRAGKNTWKATEGDYYMKRIAALTTTKRTYKNILVFDTPQETLAAGYHMLYHDEQAKVSIYGKPIDPDYPKIVLPAAVPDGVKENKSLR